MLLALTVIFLSADLLFLIALQKIYHHIPAKELRRQARAGDKLARQFYAVVAYGPSLDVFLWLCIGVLSAVLFVLLALSLPVYLAVLSCLIVVWVGFAWMPVASISKYTLRAAEFVSPLLHWILERLQPLLRKIAELGERFTHISVHTGLYDKEDIIELLKKQQAQPDNRISEQELGIVSHALTFGDLKVIDVMTPKRMIKTVSPDDSIGPILMEELHKSGHSRFPVESIDVDKQKTIVGTLYMRDMLGARHGGIVKEIMRPEVFYVNEGRELSHVLDAFLKTKYHQFLVVNSFEEIVGLITIEDVLEQIIGKPIIDEFDQYEDLRAVASSQAEKDRKSRPEVVESNEGKEAAEKETVTDVENSE
jgi:CBS domain containing-hemolysin-like protein